MSYPEYLSNAERDDLTKGLKRRCYIIFAALYCGMMSATVWAVLVIAGQTGKFDLVIGKTLSPELNTTMVVTIFLMAMHGAGCWIFKSARQHKHTLLIGFIFMINAPFLGIFMHSHGWTINQHVSIAFSFAICFALYSPVSYLEGAHINIKRRAERMIDEKIEELKREYRPTKGIVDG